MDDLDYFLSEKEGLVVVSLKGEFRTASGALLLRCLQETLARLPRGIVVHLGESGAFPREARRDLGRFLRDIRVNGTPFKLVCSDSKLGQELVESGLADRTELKPTLEEAARQVWARIKAAA